MIALSKSHLTYQCCLRGSVNRVRWQAINNHQVVRFVILEFLWRWNCFTSGDKLRQWKRSMMMSAPATDFYYATVIGVTVAGVWTVRGGDSAKLISIFIMYYHRFHCIWAFIAFVNVHGNKNLMRYAIKYISSTRKFGVTKWTEICIMMRMEK